MNLCEQAIPYLKPALKSAAVDIRLNDDEQLICRNLSNGLLVFYLVDMGGHFQYIQDRDLKKAGMKESDLYNLSIENLRKVMETNLRIQPYGSVYAVFLNGNVESSLLLVDDLWDSVWSSLVKQGVVAAAPTRDVLAFCDGSSQEGIRELRQIVERVQDGDHQLTSVLLRRNGKGWIPYAD